MNLHIVDGHSEVLEYWKDLKTPINVIHFDAHSDLNDGVFEKYLNEFSSVEISKFLVVAKHLNLISDIFWFDLRIDSVRVFKNLGTQVTDQNIYWKHKPKTEFISIEDSTQEIKDYILDIDLDVFSSLDEEGGAGEELIAKRIQKFEEIIKKLPKPKLITIARSQNPTRFVPENIVDIIQNKVVNIFSQPNLWYH